MPSVPSTKDAGTKSPGCPHAAKLLAHSNGEGKLREASFPPNGLEELTLADAGEPTRTIQINAKSAAAERKWIRPDLPSRCTWSLEEPAAESPHPQVPRSV